MIDLYIMVALYAFYLAFVVTMSTKAAWPTLSIVPKVMLAPVCIVAVMLDVFLNIVIATLIFADLPKEAMFTKRLDRYKQSGTTIEKAIAIWICKNLLDPFQVGGHCT